MAVVIVGNGMVSVRLCEELARRGVTRQRPVTVVGEESMPAYDRTRLSELFGAPRSSETLLIHPAEWYESAGIELYTKERAEVIQPRERILLTTSGRRIRYEQLVLATGGVACVPAVPGLDRCPLMVYRSAEDRARIEHRAQDAERVAILGGGLLGIELAVALRRLRCRVALVERGAHLLPRHLDAAVAGALEAELRERGIEVLCARALARVETDSGVTRLEFADGAPLDVQAVIVAAGTQPRDELARAAGLQCDPRGGVCVDDLLCTSEPGIAAIGECAVHRGVHYGVVAAGYAMADVLAQRLAGGSARFSAQPLCARLAVDGLEIAVAGESRAEGTDARVRVARTPEGCRQVVLRSGQLVGASAFGVWPGWPRVQGAVSTRARLGWRTQRRFVASGELWHGNTVGSVATWPDEVVVCQCAGTTCGELRRAYAAGGRTAAQLRDMTGAARFCGSCAPLLDELCGGPATPPQRRGLIGAAAIGAALTLLVAMAPPISMQETVRTTWHFDVLWRDVAWRQITGFALLAVAAAGFGLPLRKRLRRVQRGSVDGWRSVHAAIGVAAVALAAVHTGLRLGHYLDLALMLSFLALAAAGSMAAAATVLEARLGARWGGLAKRSSIWLHVCGVIPLPALLSLHVLKVYYF